MPSIIYIWSKLHATIGASTSKTISVQENKYNASKYTTSSIQVIHPFICGNTSILYREDNTCTFTKRNNKMSNSTRTKQEKHRRKKSSTNPSQTSEVVVQSQVQRPNIQQPFTWTTIRSNTPVNAFITYSVEQPQQHQVIGISNRGISRC